MKMGLALSVGMLALSIPAAALAQEQPGECPPGAWFCDDAEQTPVEPGDAANSAGADDDTPAERPAPPEKVEVPKASRSKHPPPIVVYHPYGEPPPVIVVEADGGHVRAYRRRPPREWGINLRLEGLMMGSDPERNPESGMGGIGGSLRYRPVPHFALDVGLDLLAGTDWAGNDRAESALLVNGMIFFNPKNKVQVYALAGFGFSAASVRQNDRATPQGESTSMHGDIQHYSYFGGQLGMGLEFRVGKKTALDFDLVGFMRGRTDDAARETPEFTDPATGRTTNTSGGGLLRGGITFYW